MLRGLYNWTIALAESRNAPVALGVVSFAESSFFPIPPDVVLLPMALARPERAWHYAFICTITSVLGGIVGYTIGYLLYDTVGKALISFYGYGARIEELRLLYAEWGHLVILIKGMTPIPYKLVTIASGIFHYDLFWFVTLSIFTRGVRFFAIAALIHFYGPSIRDFIEKRLGLVTALIALSLVGGFAIVKFAL